MSITFETTDIPTDGFPMDSVPETVDVEYACKKCGREAGPYRGRGRKPTLCNECKPKRSTGDSKSPRVTGKNAVLAARATEVLSQLNMFISIGFAAMRMFGTAGEIRTADETFREQAYAALVTDEELCKYILRAGVKSAKMTLLMAYGGMAMAVAPTAMEEIKAIRAERQALKDVEG